MHFISIFIWSRRRSDYLSSRWEAISFPLQYRFCSLEAYFDSSSSYNMRLASLSISWSTSRSDRISPKVCGEIHQIFENIRTGKVYERNLSKYSVQMQFNYFSKSREEHWILTKEPNIDLVTSIKHKTLSDLSQYLLIIWGIIQMV